MPAGVGQGHNTAEAGNADGVDRANAGAPGVDGGTFAQIEAEAWLVGLREDLVSKTYRPQPVQGVRLPR